METVLVTGGAGFVGSSLALLHKKNNPGARVICLDNLKRRGSELNLPRLREADIEFIHGDVRIPSDIEAVGAFDLMIECSAEPSVVAGYNGSPDYLLATNLSGTIHCLEACRRHDATLFFLSTSRVYPWQPLCALNLLNTSTRLALSAEQVVSGISVQGITESFPINGPRTLYGATKLASELLIMEYIDMYGVKAIINRCGVLAGPWQMGKVDQGFMVLWTACHHFSTKLAYFGFGGEGKQVRDVLHVRDLYDLLSRQMKDLSTHSGRVYNVGGGPEFSLSLKELTSLAQEATGNEIAITSNQATRAGDIPWYISDISEVKAATGWQPTTTPKEIVQEIAAWLKENENQLKHILS